MCDLKATHRLEVLLEIAGLARSTFFYHQARRACPDPHADLDVAIRTIVARVQGRYGHRRVRDDLRAGGWCVSGKTVLKRMRHLGLLCQVRRRKRFTAYRGPVGVTAPNVLNRQFQVHRPNQVWVTDVTEFRIGEDKRYLSPVLDLFDRQIIAYTVGPSPSLALVTTALRQALATLAPGEQPLVHSDQGFQYQHRDWHELLATVGARPSMSRKGNCLDNAVMESFFGQLKTELLLEVFPTPAAFTAALDAYLQWYNHERRSTVLNGLSPVQYRAQAQCR